MNKAMILATLMLVALVAPAFAPQTAAQGGSDLLIPDGTSDVQPVAGPAGQSPQPVDGVQVPDQMTGPADLTEVRFHGESPTEINLGLTVASFARAAPQVGSRVIYSICFNWDGTGDEYRLRLEVVLPAGSATGTGVAELDQNYMFDRIDGSCNPYPRSTDPFKARMDFNLIRAEVDEAAGKIDVRIPRTGFSVLSTDDEPGPLPMAGQTISNLRAYAVVRQGNSFLMYDSTDSGSTTFTTDTGNAVIKVNIAPNFQSAVAGVNERGGVPAYSVEVGRFQTVPLTIENWLDERIEANLSVSVVAGDASKWDARIIPGIPVAPKRTATIEGETVEIPGSETVTLIVNSNAAVAHKETVRLLVTATDDAFPDFLGAGLVDVKAVAPPISGLTDLYLHSQGDPCRSTDRWVNTLQTDPAAGAATQLEFRTCAQGDVGVNTGTVNLGLTFSPDVPFGRDYTVSTTEDTIAAISLKSVFRTGTSDNQQEASANTVVDVTVRVLAGPVEVASGTASDESIDGSGALINVPLKWAPETPGAATRLVPADSPFRVRVDVASDTRTFEVCNDEDPCDDAGGQREFEAPLSAVGNRIYLLTSGASKVSIPVRESSPAGAQVNITASGALVTLRHSHLGAESLKFTNPGRAVVYNLTVRNEGVNVDTARITAQVNKTGYNVEILPQTQFRLGVGQPRAFNVRVTAPANAIEDSSAGITIIATSTVDSEATARIPLTVKVTTGIQVEDEELDANLQQVDEVEDSPGLAIVPILAVIGLGALATRRRRL